MSRWLANAARERDVTLDEPRARELVYGMPYPEWKSRYQQEATPDQLERFKRLSPEDTTD
jgi:hypothetical protein